MYLKRIEAIDKNGPSLNSVIEINPDAINIAEEWTGNEKQVRYVVHFMAYLFW